MNRPPRQLLHLPARQVIAFDGEGRLASVVEGRREQAVARRDEGYQTVDVYRQLILTAGEKAQARVEPVRAQTSGKLNALLKLGLRDKTVWRGSRRAL